MGRRRWVMALGFLAAALVLAALGQFYFLRRPENLWDGLIFVGLSGACFVLAWRLTLGPADDGRRVSRGPSRVGTWLRRQAFVAGLGGAGLILSASATLLSQGRASSQDTRDVTLLWLLGMASVIGAGLWPEGARSTTLAFSLRRLRARLRSVSRDRWLEFGAVAGLTLLAFAFRLVAIESIPFTVGGDEAWHGLLARQVLHRELRNPFVMGYMSMPTLFYWPLSWSLWIVGDRLAGLRLPAVLAGTATVPVVYLLARRLWGRPVALLGAAFLATYDYHIHYSRLGANNVWDPLFVALTLWLVDKAAVPERESSGVQHDGRLRRACLVGAGLVMGLSFYFYTGARLLPALAVCYLVFLWLRGRRERAAGSALRPDLLWIVLAFLVTAGPMLSFALRHPDDWNARLNQVGIIQSGWLAREPGLTGKSTLQILAEQFLRSAGAFHVFPDRTVWYGSERPLLGFTAGIFALWGMAWAVSHWRQRRCFLLVAWFWAVIVSGGMLTESPPSSQRLVMAIPAVALLVAIGLERSVHLVRRLLGAKPCWVDLGLGLLVLSLAAGSLRYYFLEFNPARRYGGENGETATMIGRYLRGLEGETDAYLFGAPRMYWSFGTMAFLAPNVAGQDAEVLQARLDGIDRTRRNLFIFLPERAAELGWVQQALPGGEVRESYDSQGRLRFVVYELPGLREAPPPAGRRPGQSCLQYLAGCSPAYAPGGVSA